MVVVRIGKDGSLRNSRPCNNCIEQLVKYGIKRISYSLDNGTTVSEHPSSMSRGHVSSGWKYWKEVS